MEACELLAVELRIDRIEAELARELPPHLRTFARAHARGAPSPPAPDVLYRPTTLATARAALVHPVLADRGLALLRLVAPVVIESDAAVAAARAAPASWDALAALAGARDAAASARFGRRAIDVLHPLAGSTVNVARVQALAGMPSTERDGAAGAVVDLGRMQALAGELGCARDLAVPPAERDAAARRDGEPLRLPPAVAGWFEPDGVAVDDRAIAAAWDAIRARHGIDGGVRFERAARARPRAFVIEPRREVIVVIPAQVTTPAERFAVLHELGHAAVALALPAGVPRVLDEAVAAYVARAIEHEADPWHSPAAVAARARRLALARVLDRIERALPALPAPAERPAERPPWALWHDPGAQAAYIVAESLADAIARAIDHPGQRSPLPGALAAAAAAQRAVIDQLASAVDPPSAGRAADR